MAFCGFCGYNNESGSTFCPMCGRPMNGPTLDNPLRGKAIASMVLGIIACALSGIVGIVTGTIGLNFSLKIKKDPDAYLKNKGVVTAGFICSIIGLCLGVLTLILEIILIIFYVNLFTSGYLYY